MLVVQSKGVREDTDGTTPRPWLPQHPEAQSSIFTSSDQPHSPPQSTSHSPQLVGYFGRVEHDFGGSQTRLLLPSSDSKTRHAGVTGACGGRRTAQISNICLAARSHQDALG